MKAATPASWPSARSEKGSPSRPRAGGQRGAFEAALEHGNFAAVSTDYSIGSLKGLHVLRRVKAKYPDVPALMLTGTGIDEVVVKAIKEGADDYLLKSQLRLDRLPRAIAATLEYAR